MRKTKLNSDSMSGTMDKFFNDFDLSSNIESINDLIFNFLQNKDEIPSRHLTDTIYKAQQIINLLIKLKEEYDIPRKIT